MSKRKDQIEEFISENRGAFDNQKAPSQLWDGINNTLHNADGKNHRSLKSNIIRWVSVAAVGAILFFAGAASNIFDTQSQSRQANYNASPSLSDVSPEFKEVESFYKQELEVKLAKLTSFEPDTIIHQDMAELEEIYGELRKELARSPEATKEQVVKAMIDNYKTRIQILEMVLERLEDSEKRKNSGDAPIRM